MARRLGSTTVRGMNSWAVLLAVVSGVAAALVNDPRPKAKAAKKKAPPDSSTSVPKTEPGPAPSPAEAPRPAETPLDIEVRREGVASALPLIVVGQEANLSSGTERRAGESRRKRRSRPEEKTTQSTQAAGPVVHRCPACGHALAPELAPIAVESVNAAAPATPLGETPTAPGAAAAPEPAPSEEQEEANEDEATPECACSEAPATPEPAATPRRGSRVGVTGERLTLRLATRHALGKLG